MVGHLDTPGLLRKHGCTEIKKVGEGSFGKAILVRNNDGVQLICKMVDVSRASAKETQDAVKEAKVLASLNHPYIVRYRESFTDSGWFCILMDYCEAGDLTKQIEQAKRTRKPIAETQVLKWFTQAILSLKYIHDRHILHRDLKPQNFFLSKSGSLKMGDFGIAKVLDCTLAVARTQIGTPYYLSPELCQEKPYTTPSDIWAMGCILYEMCALKVPFDGASIAKLVDSIVRGRIPTPPGGYSPFVRQLVVEILNRDANKRPGCDEILQRSEIQAVVKSMMDEAQEKEGAPASGGAGPAAPEAAPKVMEGPYKDKAGNYKRNDLVEYHSSAHQNWLPAVVINVDNDGRILIDLKPNTWMAKEQQASSVRPRSGGADGSTPAAAAPRVSASPSRGASPRRSPSQGSNMRAPSPQRAAQPMSARGAAGNYRNGDLCEFWSNSHNDWLPAQVVNTDAAGRLIIDLKPNTWLSKEEQTAKIRPRKAPERPSSGQRPPQIGGSPQLPRPPMHRSPSWGNADNRAPSPGGRAMTPSGGRAQSPSGRGVTPTPPGWRAPSPAGRAASPSGRPLFGQPDRPMTPSRRRLESPGRAASPRGYNPAGIAGGPRPPRLSASPLRAGGAHIAGL